VAKDTHDRFRSSNMDRCQRFVLLSRIA